MRGFGVATLLLASAVSAFVVPVVPSTPSEPQSDDLDIKSLDDTLNPLESSVEDEPKPFVEWSLPKSTAEVTVDITDIVARDGVDTALLQFNLEVQDSEKICGDGNFLVNGKKLEQEVIDNDYSGKGSLKVDGHNVEASWSFQCVKGIDSRPVFRFLTVNIESVDGHEVAAQALGFVAQFQQQSERTMIMFAEPDLSIKVPNLEDDFEEEHEPTLEEVFDDLHFLKHQMRELEWQIEEKRSMLRELTGGKLAPVFSQCDNLACITEVLLHKAKGFAHHVAGKLGGGRGRHHGPPPWKKHGHHGNHTERHGNHSLPHPPHRGHPPHRRPHHRIPVCRLPFPPHFRHPHGPPHDSPHRPPPPPHHRKPGKHHGDVPPPPPPPPGHGPPHGDHPPPPPHHDGGHRGPPGSDGPPPPPPPPPGPPGSPSRFSNQHDHFEGPPPPLLHFLQGLRFVVVGLIATLLIAGIARHCCCTNTSRKEHRLRRKQERHEERMRRKEMRKAARKQAWREWALGLVRQKGVALPMTDEEEADYEEKRAMLMEEARVQAENEVGQEIAQLRRAAGLVDDMVVDGERTVRASFETALPDYRSEAGDFPLPSYDDAEEEVDSIVSDGSRPGGHHYSPSNSSISDIGSVRSIIQDAKE